MGKEERIALIEKYGRAFGDFETALYEIPKDIWQFKPEPKEWSVHEVIVHLADSETNSYLRARRLIADPGQLLMAYDQDHWANTLDYHAQDWKSALELTRWARKTTYDLIKTLPDQIWSHSAAHPEYDEPFRFEKWLSIYANHPLVHKEQIQNNYEIWKAQQT